MSKYRRFDFKDIKLKQVDCVSCPKWVEHYNKIKDGCESVFDLANEMHDFEDNCWETCERINRNVSDK